jgi:hypothetical protein
VPLVVTRATLAPGYIGFYLVEAELPAVVDAGPAELYREAGRVRAPHAPPSAMIRRSIGRSTL